MQPLLVGDPVPVDGPDVGKTDGWWVVGARVGEDVSGRVAGED